MPRSDAYPCSTARYAPRRLPALPPDCKLITPLFSSYYHIQNAKFTFVPRFLPCNPRAARKAAQPYGWTAFVLFRSEIGMRGYSHSPSQIYGGVFEVISQEELSQICQYSTCYVRHSVFLITKYHHRKPEIARVPGFTSPCRNWSQFEVNFDY